MVYPLQFVHINSIMFSEGKGGYTFLNKIFFFSVWKKRARKGTEKGIKSLWHAKSLAGVL